MVTVKKSMKYLFLAYGDVQQRGAMSTSERAAFGEACLANDEALRKSGHLLAAEGLRSSSTATTVRVQNGKISLTDGPLAETKEPFIFFSPTLASTVTPFLDAPITAESVSFEMGAKRP